MKPEIEKEVKEALSMALSSNLLKEDSLLSRYIAETWAAQNGLEEALNKFKIELSKSGNTTLIDLGEKIESSSVELKQSITNASRVIEETKMQIIKILD
jgi:hypothetical protein